MKSLILGGIKSGKSRFAEQLAIEQSEEVGRPVSLIVTAQGLDEGMAQRIARHQAERPLDWISTEAPVHLGSAIEQNNSAGVVLVDCLTLWLTNLLMADDETLLRSELQLFEQAVQSCTAPLILVSNETNMGIVPMGELTRRYCDEIGLLHQRTAQQCDRVTLVMAGLPMDLKSTS